MAEHRAVRILVVDDSIADVRLIRAALLEHSTVPVEITVAPDGAEAISLLESTPFDVVILDLSMPKVDGYAVLERYKRSYPPIIVFSSSGNEADANRSLALGARE